MEMLPDLTREQIQQAVDQLSEGETRNFGKSTKYLVEADGKYLFPKVVVGMAAQIATGEPFGPADFSSGFGTKQACGILERHNFKIVTMAERNELALRNNGFLFHAQKEWIEYQLKNSIGKTAVYTRGPKGSIKQVGMGSKIFCMKHRTKAIFLWGMFSGCETLSKTEAWDRFGTQLGADSENEWLNNISKLDSIRESQEITTIQISGVRSTSPSIAVYELLSELPARLQNGKILNPSEVREIMSSIPLEGDDEEAYQFSDLDVDVSKPISPPGTRKGRPGPKSDPKESTSPLARDQVVGCRAAKLANYTCEIDPSHTTFVTTKGTAFIEKHHLIPREYHEEFDLETDHEYNIFCLCPLCHRKIHLANKSTKEELVTTLYDLRSDRLLEYYNLELPKLLSFY